MPLTSNHKPLALVLFITKLVSVLLGLGLAIVFFLLTTFFAMETGREVISLITLVFGLIMTSMAMATLYFNSNRVLFMNVLLVSVTSAGVWWAILDTINAWR